MKRSISRRALRWTARSAIIAVAAGVLAAVQLPAAPAASAATGTYITTDRTEWNSKSSTQSARAFCSPGDRVLGGGGGIREPGTPTRQVVLTQLVPFRSHDRDGYLVAAAETGMGTNGWWQVQAYAICAADPSNLLDVQIVSDYSEWSPDDFKTAAAVCPAGKVALGTGARLSRAVNGEAALQLSRASGPGDISRAQAQETDSWRRTSFVGSWRITSYAVCAKRPAGYEVTYGPPSVNKDSEWIKGAYVYCPPGKQLYGAGGAITSLAPPNVSLQEVTPIDSGRDKVVVLAVENTPTSRDWDYILAQAVCAY